MLRFPQDCFEFPNVSRPVVIVKPLQKMRRDGLVLLGLGRYQERDVFFMHPKRGEKDDIPRETMEKVLSKAVPRHQLEGIFIHANGRSRGTVVPH